MAMTVTVLGCGGIWGPIVLTIPGDPDESFEPTIAHHQTSLTPNLWGVQLPRLGRVADPPEVSTSSMSNGSRLRGVLGVPTIASMDLLRSPLTHRLTGRGVLVTLAVALVVTAATGVTASAQTTTTGQGASAERAVARATPKLPIRVKSVGNEVVEVTDVSRIVVLNGDVNEILYALGMGDRIVANDITGYFPDDAKKKPKIGYQRTLSAEAILSFRPTLVIGNTDAGPPAVLTQLRGAGVAVVIVEAGDDVADAPKKIRRVGAAVGLMNEGDALGDKIETQLRAVQKKWSDAANRYEPRAAFLYLRGPRTQLLGGSGTRANAMLLGAGATDAGAFYANVKGYVPITSEALVQANPDVIVVLDDGLESVGGIDGLMKIPGIALTKAGQNKRILSFDDLKLLELGPRTPDALDELSRALYAPFKK